MPLLSAYKEALGREPDFTNYAQVLNDPPFIDTLDYIFLSTDSTKEDKAEEDPGTARASRWQVESVLNIPHRELVKGPLPTEEEPSDHIMLSATLSIAGAESDPRAPASVPKEYEDLSAGQTR